MHIRAPSDGLDARFAAGLRRAAAGDLPVADLVALAGTLLASGQDQPTRALYQAWLEHQPDDPLAFAMYFNYGNLLFGAQSVAEAQAAFQAALTARPDFNQARLMLGLTLERQGDLGQAAQQWLTAVDQLDAVQGEAVRHKTLALKQIGRVCNNAKQYALAEDALRQCLELDPHQRDAAEHWLGLRQIQCKWPVIEPFGPVSRAALVGSMSPLLISRMADTPMHLLAAGHAVYRRECAARREIETAGAWPAPRTLRRPDRLRIGYLCSDLRAHALGSLLVGIFGLHDRARFEVFAYYTGPDVQDPIRARIEGSVGYWRDIAQADDKAAAARIVADRVDILVDLNGHTDSARPYVFAIRPAPIAVNWLGYPGTMGTPHHHYIIADSTTIPPGSEKYYSETVRRLPCYQPNDRERVLVADTPPRAAFNLPEAAMVYCCFNTTAKITPAQFGRWLAILAGVPDSILWLLTSGDAVDARLRDVAGQAGIGADRLVFASILPNAAHLARYRLADLFLDTFPYGAHTTASDALWMGLPVVTLMGRSFASRVCGSLVRSAGLPALACETPEDYVQTAVRLGLDPAARRQLRQSLQAARNSCALFDTAGLVRSLESRFDDMWADYASGSLPVPDLTNLPLYEEIGRHDVFELTECWDHEAYDERYRRALAYRHALSPLPADRRLWHGQLG
jgi:predicted O-linked N-acetylglucosamine transferase (SPINDLY family)